MSCQVVRRIQLYCGVGLPSVVLFLLVTGSPLRAATLIILCLSKHYCGEKVMMDAAMVMMARDGEKWREWEWTKSFANTN